MKIKTNWSKWIDVGCYESSGHYFLIQMKYDTKTNKKIFRKAKMGFVNDYTKREGIFQNILKFNAE